MIMGIFCWISSYRLPLFEWETSNLSLRCCLETSLMRRKAKTPRVHQFSGAQAITVGAWCEEWQNKFTFKIVAIAGPMDWHSMWEVMEIPINLASCYLVKTKELVSWTSRLSLIYFHCNIVHQHCNWTLKTIFPTKSWPSS